MKELSPYQLGCHLDEDESPFSLVQPLCYEDHWVVFRTPEELDAVERALDVRSAHDSKLQRRLRAERLRLQPEMSSPDPASSPVEVWRRAFVEQMMSGVAPSMLVLEQMFRQVGEAMSIVPLSPRIVKLLDLTADVRGLLPFKCPRLPAHRKAGGDGEDMEEEHWRKVRNEQELVASLRDRLFAIELTLFPHCLGREWTQEKRNAFRRRLASVRPASRIALLMHQFATAALEAVRVLSAAELPPMPVDKTPRSKTKHYVPAVGDEVVYIPTGHRQHLQDKSQPPRPWEGQAQSSKHHVACVVEDVRHYKPVLLNVFKTRDFADEVEDEGRDKKRGLQLAPMSLSCLCVRLRPVSLKKKHAAGVAAHPAACTDGCFQVTMYEDSSLPEFVVNKATFDKGCQLMKGTRVKMYFSNVDSGTQRKAAAKPAGTWYTGVVVNNLFPVDGQPWECVQVRWDNDTQLTMACPWELTEV